MTPVQVKEKGQMTFEGVYVEKTSVSTTARRTDQGVPGPSRSFPEVIGVRKRLSTRPVVGTGGGSRVGKVPLSLSS